MTTKIKPELSSKNKYYISKHRYYELEHFCLQYPEWVKEISKINALNEKGNECFDPTSKYAVRLSQLNKNIEEVSIVASLADPYISSYIFEAVTKGHCYDYLSTELNIPCSREYYYDKYRKFFWILSTRKYW